MPTSSSIASPATACASYTVVASATSRAFPSRGVNRPCARRSLHVRARRSSSRWCSSTTATGASRSAAAIPGCATGSLNLVTSGTLTIGADNPAFPPWFGGEEKKPWKISDPNSGKGYESAVAYAVAKQLGFAKAAVKWTYVPFTNSFRARKEAVRLLHHPGLDTRPPAPRRSTFSKPYYYVNQAVVGRKGKPIAGARSVAGLQKYKLGAQLGTTSYEYIVNNIKPSSTPLVYNTNDLAVQALKNGQIDGIVVDLPTAFYVTAVQVSDGKIVGQLPTAASKERFGLVLAKGNPLAACVNKAIDRLWANGDDQDAPAHLAREGDRRAGPEVARAGREPRARGSSAVRPPASRERSRGRDRCSRARSSSRCDRRRRSPARRAGTRSRRTSSTGRATATRSRRSLRAFWLNVKLFLIAEAIILAAALSLAVLRSLPGPVFFPIRAARDRLRGLLPRHADDPGHPHARLGMPALRLAWHPDVAVLLGRVALVLVYTAYVSEVYRAGIESVHPSQEAAARSLGLTHGQSLRYVIVPAGRAARDPAAAQRLHRPAEGHGARRRRSASSRRSSRRRSTRRRRSTARRTSWRRHCSCAITIPLARFTDWLVARDRRRQQAGGSREAARARDRVASTSRSASSRC